MATTFYHPQHCGNHSLLSTALGGRIPIPTAERPALMLTPATWQPPSPSQDLIATTSTTESPHLASVKPKAIPHKPPPTILAVLVCLVILPHQHRDTCSHGAQHFPQCPAPTRTVHRARRQLQLSPTEPDTNSPHSLTTTATAHSARRPVAPALGTHSHYSVRHAITTTFHCIKLPRQPIL